MFHRAAVVFCVLVLSAVFALQQMVQNHVEAVAVVHAKDKARHKTDMIENLENLESFFTRNGSQHSVLTQIRHMAHDKDILGTVLYNKSGTQIMTDHSTHSVARAGDHAKQSNHVAQHEMAPEAKQMRDLGHADHSTHAAPQPALPKPLESRPTYLPKNTNSIEIGSGFGDFDSSIVTATVPVQSKTGQQIGFVEYQIDVTDVMVAYSAGLRRFAVVLIAFGIAIFGIPALGYLIQKRIADRSSSNAKYLASYDALTGLLNRRGFMTRAECKVENGAVANVAYLDADKFKSINDTYGHAVGDAYLRRISEEITALFGDKALTSRLGGDEFVIADTASDLEEFVGLLERLCEACAKEIELNGVTIRSSVSTGIASVETGCSLDEALSNADLALYFAKAAGGNCVSVYDKNMAAEMMRRRTLEARLREAVAQKDFTLHYQPLIQSQSQEIFGYEALLRLEDDEGNLIPPTEFIPLAESMGLINEIGEWVIYSATRQIAEMNCDAMVAVNLSTEQFKSGQLLGIVQDALAQANLLPSRLELEITESLLLDNSTEVAMQIDALKDMGVSVAMDDFGTGFSSLSYLWKFGFDRIKIDRSFIQALEEDPERSLGLIESIVMLGKKLDMEITAEGIETQNQSEILSSLGCDVLQGFYYGRPEPLSVPNAIHQTKYPVAKTG